MTLCGWEAMMLSNLIGQFHFHETVGPSKWTLRLVSSFVTVLLLVVVVVALLRLLHLLQSLQLEDITLQTLVEVVKRVGLELLLHHRHRDVRQLDVHLQWQDWMKKQLENEIKLSFWFEDRRSKPKLIWPASQVLQWRQDYQQCRRPPKTYREWTSFSLNAEG